MRSLSLFTLTLSFMLLYVLASPSSNAIYRYPRRELSKRHSQLTRSQVRNANTSNPNEDGLAPSNRRLRRGSGKCKQRPTSALPSAPSAIPQNVAAQPKPSKQSSSNKPKPTSPPSPPPPPSNNGGSRMDMIRDLYAFSGFVYNINTCPSSDQMTNDFKSMASKGARAVITYDRCGSGDSGFFGNLISAAGKANIKVIPLVFNINSDINAEMGAVIDAVKKNPDPVLAVSLGDEPLFSGLSVSDVTSKINYMRSQFKGAGLTIPLSISELAFGWQQSKDFSQLADAVDFFMINNFPYFSGSVQNPNSDSTFGMFKNDINFFEGIAKGRPLLVTQTGWASNKDLHPPTNANLQTSVGSEQSYYQMLDAHCGDYFKAKNIGWMWRSWDDSLPGWGVKDTNGNFKFNVNAKTTC